MNTTPIEFMAWDKLELKIVNIKMWDEEAIHSTNENGTVWHEGYCARIGK